MVLILNKVFIIFLYIVIGISLNKLKILNLESNKHLTNLVIYLTTPCLLFSSMLGQHVQKDLYKNTIFALIISLTLMLLMAILSTYFVSKMKSVQTADIGVFAVAMTACNSGFMGFPIAKSVFGNPIFYYIIVQNVILNIYLFFISVIQLHIKDGPAQNASFKERISKLFLNPVVLISFISIFLLFTNTTVPKYPLGIIKSIGDITIPLSMIIVGVQLGNSNLKRAFSSSPYFITAFMKLIFFPLFSFIIMYFIPLDNSLKLSLVLTTTFPTAVISVSIAEYEEKNATVMAENVACTTIFSMITLPIWLMILAKIFM